MTDQPVLFLSSTIASLRDLRTALEEELEKLGYRSTITDGTPPPDPSSSVEETCLRAVESCDILVLILDKEYGTEVNGKWLVKEEFHRAQETGKPSYVCVRTPLWTIYETWQRAGRPTVDVEAAYGINEKVLRFLDEITVSAEHWILRFERAQDLAGLLRESLAAYFARLLRTRAQTSILRVAHLVEMMNDSYRQGKHVQALLACEQILRLDKSNVEALLSRAVCKIRLHGLNDRQALQAGIQDCLRVLDLDPHNYRARYNMANFKLLCSNHTVQEVEHDLSVLFKEFPEYKYYFDQDKEFRVLIDLRKEWESRPGSGHPADSRAPIA
jgi:tetratricopeptide (TPR) repeat protein